MRWRQIENSETNFCLRRQIIMENWRTFIGRYFGRQRQTRDDKRQTTKEKRQNSWTFIGDKRQNLAFVVILSFVSERIHRPQLAGCSHASPPSISAYLFRVLSWVLSTMYVRLSSINQWWGLAFWQEELASLLQHLKENKKQLPLGSSSLSLCECGSMSLSLTTTTDDCVCVGCFCFRRRRRSASAAAFQFLHKNNY